MTTCFSLKNPHRNRFTFALEFHRRRQKIPNTLDQSWANTSAHLGTGTGHAGFLGTRAPGYWAPKILWALGHLGTGHPRFPGHLGTWVLGTQDFKGTRAPGYWALRILWALGHLGTGLWARVP